MCGRRRRTRQHQPTNQKSAKSVKKTLNPKERERHRPTNGRKKEGEVEKEEEKTNKQASKSLLSIGLLHVGGPCTAKESSCEPHGDGNDSVVEWETFGYIRTTADFLKSNWKRTWKKKKGAITWLGLVGWLILETSKNTTYQDLKSDRLDIAL